MYVRLMNVIHFLHKKFQLSFNWILWIQNITQLVLHTQRNFGFIFSNMLHDASFETEKKFQK